MSPAPLPAVGYFQAMAGNNAWANHRLYRACRQLDEGGLRQARTSFFPSIALTLNHLMLVDLFYVDALEGGRLGHAAFARHDDPPPLAELADRQATLDRRLIVFTRALDERHLAAPVEIVRPDHVQIERTDRLLLHLFQHQVHHRGQAHAMLAGTAVAPPQLDEFFPAADAELRREDLDELGFTDADWWGAAARPPG